MFLFFLFSSNIAILNASEEIKESDNTDINVETVFDLSNPNEQTKTIEKDGVEYTFTVSKELSFMRSNEYVPNGSFNRVFSLDTGVK